MYKKLGTSAAILGLLSSAQFANAADDDLGIYGFLSVGASMLVNNNENEDKGVDGVTLDGFDDQSGNFKQDAIFGLQITKQINESTSATGQLVSRGTSDYNTEASWAFVTYNANKDLDLRMGRLRIPFFYYSEFLEVGYAYNWIRTPSDVYSIPFSSFDGADATQRFSFGKVDGSVKVNYGRFNETIELYGEDYNADLRNVFGLTLDLNHGDFGYRFSAQQTEITFDNQLGGTRTIELAQAGVQQLIAANGYNQSLAEDFDFKGHKANFYDAAITFNNGDYGFVAEANTIQYESALLLDTFQWMVSGSKRFNDVTVHTTYSTSKNVFDGGDQGKIQEALKLDGEDASIIVGARYDYSAGTAIKVEAQHHNEMTKNGENGNSAMLYSVAVDMIF